MPKSRAAFPSVTLFILFAPVIVSAAGRWHYMSTVNRLSKDPQNKVFQSLEKRTKTRMSHVHWASAVTERNLLQRGSPGAMNRGFSAAMRSSRKTTTSSCSTVSKQLSFGSSSGPKPAFVLSRKQKMSGRVAAQSAMQKSQACGGTEHTKATTMRQIVSLKDTKAT